MDNDMTDNLTDACVAAGAAEFSLKVSQVGPDAKTPIEWQALVKHWNATLQWGCGVAVTPQEAALQARQAFLATHAPQRPKRTRAPVPAPRVRKRTRSAPGA
jgi:hypothetical protein